MDKSSCAIIIPYWDAPVYLKQCLNSIHRCAANSSISVTVIVVDNGAIPFRGVDYPLTITHIRIERSLGYARAVNLGIYASRAMHPDMIIILNQDTKLKGDFLNVAVRKAVSTHTLYLPLILDSGTDRLTVWYTERYFSNTPRGILKRRSGLAPLEQGSGICIIARTEALWFAGYFDPNFEMYYEDTDYFERFKRRGGGLMLIADCAVEHVGQSSTLIDPTRSRNTSWKRNSMIYLAWKRGNVFRMLSMVFRSYVKCLVSLDFIALAAYLQKDINLLKIDKNNILDHSSLQAVALARIQEDMKFLDETL